MDFVTFTIIIDDIVFPDGRTAMGVLGGGGPQTAVGMKLWADRVGLVANVGADLPDAARQWLDEMDIDAAGVRGTDELPTLRAWQLLEEDGRRTQIWRVLPHQIGPQIGRTLESLAASGYETVRGFHIGAHVESPNLEFLRALRARCEVLSLEIFRPAEKPLRPSALHDLVSAGHIFSLNQLEAESLVGTGEPVELAGRLGKAGAPVVALRCGAAGSVVYRTDTGETHVIPAVATHVVDPVGAGNAYCGAFLAGWVQTRDLRTAGLYGAVAASFLIEQVGLPPARADLRQRAQERLQTLREQA